MSRAHRTYGDRSAATRTFEGFDVENPVPGYYRFKLRSGGVLGVVRIWWGQPADPVTGETLDRSYRWQAAFNGELIDFERAWPACARMPATEDDYRAAVRRQQWARENAPDSAYADHTRRLDPLSTDNPLPF